MPLDNVLLILKKDLEGKLEELGQFKGFDCSFEFAVHTRKDGLNKTENLFRFIRNSFAHGGFRTCIFEGAKYYALENRDDKGMLTGRGVISEASLLHWADLLAQPRSSKKRAVNYFSEHNT